MYSSFGTDFNHGFHATLDDRVEPVRLHFRDEAELAELGTPWTAGRDCVCPTKTSDPSAEPSGSWSRRPAVGP